jgi:anti-sigma factor RsiW
MTCPEATERLDDYVDGELGEAAFQEIELHLAGCPACRDEERRLRALLAHAASLPRERAPSRDLWPEIAARAGRPRVLRFVPRWGAPALVAAAAAVVAVVSAVSLSRGTGPSAAPSPLGAGTAIPAAAGGEGLAQAEAEYERAAAALMTAVEQRRAALSPETVAAVEENVRAIDGALAQIRAALRDNPDDRRLAYLLASTHQRKVEVLRRVVRLSTPL